MHLIHTTDLYIRTWSVNPPLYAILSHRWDDDENEVSYQDFQTGKKRSASGYLKILRLCELAKAIDLEWAWIDTACIDKTSSSELSEAVNSMFAWYKESQICFVFFSDNDMLIFNETASDAYPERRLIPTMEHDHNIPFDPYASEEYANSWFGRGWTLQELLAPTVVHFFHVQAVSTVDLTCTTDERRDRLLGATTLLGSKETLKDRLVRATGIDEMFILNLKDVKTASLAQRMSWASRRTTSRPEDIAYCLLGIFGINMTLLYGERQNAFLRLQETILASSADETIFAWASNGSKTCRGLLASSPAEFGRYSCAQPFETLAYRPPVRIAGGGIEISNALPYYLPILADCLIVCAVFVMGRLDAARFFSLGTDVRLACNCQCGAPPYNANLTITLRKPLEDVTWNMWELSPSQWIRSNPQSLKSDSRLFSPSVSLPVFVTPWLHEISQPSLSHQTHLDFNRVKFDTGIKWVRYLFSLMALNSANIPNPLTPSWYRFALGYKCAPSRLLYLSLAAWILDSRASSASLILCNIFFTGVFLLWQIEIIDGYYFQGQNTPLWGRVLLALINGHLI